MSNLRSFFLVGIAAIVFAFGSNTTAQQLPDNDRFWNPEPLLDDFVLPLSPRARLVFRRILVPGKGFWGDARRIVETGDPTGGMFETPQRRVVGGAFPAKEEDNWLIFIGKYEVTKALYVEVMGRGDVAAGLAALEQASGDPGDAEFRALPFEKLQKELRKPMTWISWPDWQLFINNINMMCFEFRPCRRALPNNGDAPGYFRLPSEIEWEYAARGGVGGGNEVGSIDRFGSRLPFPEAEWKNYAWVSPLSKSKATYTGRLKATSGLHDLFGNVQEVVIDPFYADSGQGKVGDLTVRGGSFLTPADDLRSSLRSEIAIYQLKGDKIEVVRSPTTGIRLALGSAVIAGPETLETISREFSEYRRAVRDETPSGESIKDTILLVNNPLNSIEEISKSLTLKFPDSNASEIATYIEEARKLIRLRSQESIMAAVRLSLTALRDFIVFRKEIAKREALLKVLARLTQTDETKRRIQKVKKDMDGLEAQKGETLGYFVGFVDDIQKFGVEGKQYAASFYWQNLSTGQRKPYVATLDAALQDENVTSGEVSEFEAFIVSNFEAFSRGP